MCSQLFPPLSKRATGILQGQAAMRQISAPKPSSEPSPPPYPSRRGNGLWESVVHAWSGLVHTVLHQRNMRIHVTAAILVGLVGSGIPLGLAEKVTLIFCVLFIFFAEILNSALEHLVDLAVQEVHEKARGTKDAAAAGVLVLAIGTVVIFAALLVHNWHSVVTRGPQIQRQVLFGVPLAASAAVLMMDYRKPVVADIALFLFGCVLLVALAQQSESYVFTGLTFGLLVLAGECARLRQKKSADPFSNRRR
jgi:diacylglycerol kinase (ATP)